LTSHITAHSARQQYFSTHIIALGLGIAVLISSPHLCT
jgi:hypothetical protein